MLKFFWQIRNIKKAINLAKKYYSDKKDGSETLIFDHSFRVALKLFEILKDIKINKKKKEEIIIAGLFHDLIEDTNIKNEEILQFSKNIFKYTKQMTISFDKGIKKAVKPLYKINDEVFLIKLADINDNVTKSFFFIRKNGLEWYKNFFIPLLNEYLKLIDWKIKKNKNRLLKNVIINFSQLTISKINQLKETLKNYEKLSII